MSEEEKKAIEILKSMNDGYTFKDCSVCRNYNEKTGCCDKKKCSNLKAIETVLDLIEKQNKELEPIRELGIPVKTVVAELNRLEDLEDDREQLIYSIKENQKIISGYIADYCKRCDELRDSIPKSVIREKIEEIQKLYEEELKKLDIGDFEVINFNNFKAIRLEVQRAILKELLGDE